MSSHTLLSTQLPITILPPSATLPSSPPTTPSTPLSATLTYNALSTTLTLTLSDLSTRLLLLSVSLTPALYAPVRSAHSLRLDFASFPSRLAELLLLPRSDPSYILQLHLPERDDGATVPLRLVQFNAYKAFLHVELPLRRASKEELVAALAARAREAESAIADAAEKKALADERLRLLGQARAEFEQLKNSLPERDEVQRTADEASLRAGEAHAQNQALRAQIAERDQRLHGLQSELAEVHGRVGTLPGLQDARAEAERRAVAAEAVMAEGRAAADLLCAERDAARTELNATREREGRRQTELRASRAKGKVKAAVIAKQEAAVRAAEKRIAALEREVRRARDRAAMLEVEKEGLSGRLSSACSKLEENAAVLQSDQQVIEYLSRELNERLVGGEWDEAERGRGRRETTANEGGRGDDLQRDVPVTSR